jgi:WD40 repeat protein
MNFATIKISNSEAPDIKWSQHNTLVAPRVDQLHDRLAVKSTGIRIYDLAMRNEQMVLRHSYTEAEKAFFWGAPNMGNWAWSSDGLLLFTKSAEPYDATVWDVSNGSTIFRLFRKVDWHSNTHEWICGAAIGPNKTLLAVAVGTGSGVFSNWNRVSEIRLYDLHQKCLSHRLALEDDLPTYGDMKFSPDGKYVALHEGLFEKEILEEVDAERLLKWSKRSRLILYEVLKDE